MELYFYWAIALQCLLSYEVTLFTICETLMFTKCWSYNVQWVLRLHCSLSDEVTLLTECWSYFVRWVMKLHCSVSAEVTTFTECWSYIVHWVLKLQFHWVITQQRLLGDEVTLFNEWRGNIGHRMMKLLCSISDEIAMFHGCLSYNIN